MNDIVEAQPDLMLPNTGHVAKLLGFVWSPVFEKSVDTELRRNKWVRTDRPACRRFIGPHAYWPADVPRTCEAAP